jgi:hypothetical protein
MTQWPMAGDWPVLSLASYGISSSWADRSDAPRPDPGPARGQPDQRVARPAHGVPADPALPPRGRRGPRAAARVPAARDAARDGLGRGQTRAVPSLRLPRVRPALQHTGSRYEGPSLIASNENLEFTGLAQNLGQLLRLLLGFSVKLLGQLANVGSAL